MGELVMRLVVWNTDLAVHRKLDALDGARPDMTMLVRIGLGLDCLAEFADGQSVDDDSVAVDVAPQLLVAA